MTQRDLKTLMLLSFEVQPLMRKMRMLVEEETIGGDNYWSFADGLDAYLLPFPCYRCGVLGDAAGDVCEHEHDVAGDL